MCVHVYYSYFEKHTNHSYSLIKLASLRGIYGLHVGIYFTFLYKH